MNDIELINLLEQLLKEPDEQTWLEFKTNVAERGASVTPSGIGEYISALSNGACINNKDFGYLVLGVEDKTHRIVGTNLKPKDFKIGNQDFELWLRTMLYPKISFEIFELLFNNKPIVVFRIPAAKSEPVNFQKKPFIRINSQKTDLRNYPDYVRQIYNSQEDWSAKIVEQASIRDLDEEALIVARKHFKDRNANETFCNDIDNWDTASFLDKAKVTINGKITNTALILLGKPESSHFLLPSFAEITWKLDTNEKAYEHFGPPFLLNTTRVYQRIRNYQYKFFPDNQLLSVMVNKYEARVILEALHNAIAHQDYSRNARIIVTEKSGKVIFQNAGSFFSGSPDEYFFGDKTPDKYRNPWLAKAMVNLGMIDTMGYGIHSMIIEQRKRYFPLPDYSKSNSDNVILEIFGQEIDINYSKLLIENTNLDLRTVILLDRVQKKLPITDEAAAMLRKLNLIEGRKPNYFVSLKVASVTGKKAAYTRNKAFDKAYYVDLILKAISHHKSVSRKDINELLFDKLPDVYSDRQKVVRINNLIAELSRKKIIINLGSDPKPKWVLNEKN
ncbi:MAG: transcriptional regulator [Sphingobacteriales bacterium]|nr:transcriptional regulator [Sphingobacteriales bacterium]